MEGCTDRGSRNDGVSFLFLSFNADKTCPEPMRCALLDGTTPDQTGRGLAMAHHYRTINHYRMINHYHTTGTGTKAPPHAGGSPLPQARPGETKNEISTVRDQPAPESIESPSIHTETQVGSEGMPHVGHADSIMNNEHGSWSDVSD